MRYLAFASLVGLSLYCATQYQPPNPFGDPTSPVSQDDLARRLESLGPDLYTSPFASPPPRNATDPEAYRFPQRCNCSE